MSRVLLLVGGLLCAGAVAAALFVTLRDDPALAELTASDPSDEATAQTTEAPDGEPEDPAPSGYAGTSAARRGGRARAAAPAEAPREPGPEPAPPREDPAPIFAAESELGTLAGQLARQRDYTEILRLLYRMGGPPVAEPGARPAASEARWRFRDATPARTTRFRNDPERMAGLLDGALAAARNGVVRQALIFHMALALPPEFALPRLRALEVAPDPDDAEDALCALAFTGDEGALARFEALARTPTTCCGEVRVDYYEDAAALFRQGRRDILRSYRCIEALDAAPYFHIHGLWMEDVGLPFPWAEGADRPPALVERALPAWLQRYPGHAGSDDMAYRMADLRIEQGRALDALRWASLGSVSPDGDTQGACVHQVISLVELAPRGAQVMEDVIDPAAPDRNRDLLVYLRLRRHAQDLGWRTALREAAEIAASEPDLVISRAWNDRWSAPVPRGLDSGLAPIPADDPLRRAEPPRSGGSGTEAASGGSATARLLRPDVLRRQLRAWETMAELETRRASSPAADGVDLRYKEAAIHFHERDVLYPAYATHNEYRSRRPRTCWHLAEALPGTSDGDTWIHSVLSWELAAQRFEEIVRLAPRHPLADDAVYSLALAHVKAADDRAVRAIGPDERDRHLRAALVAFEDLISRHPQSPYAASAEAALGWWRRARKDLF